VMLLVEDVKNVDGRVEVGEDADIGDACAR
jgi:hypothetical protein